MARTGLFGGTFNPPHIGHVRALQRAKEAMAFDRLVVLPAGSPPHKALPAGTPPPGERMKLCELAFGEIPRVEVSDLELRRRGRSYTADTVEQLARSYPADELWLILGSDMFFSFQEWYRPERILAHCGLAVMFRREDLGKNAAEQKRRLEEQYGAKIVVIENQLVDVSSTAVRERLRRGEGTEDLPPAVAEYILRRGLYR